MATVILDFPEVMAGFSSAACSFLVQLVRYNVGTRKKQLCVYCKVLWHNRYITQSPIIPIVVLVPHANQTTNDLAKLHFCLKKNP